MTPKQKLKSIEKKMERLQFNNDRINLQQASRYFADIKRYNELEREQSFLKFQIEHCQTCGRKL
jgi:hypothetical protein